ncbi:MULTISPECIES: flavodoxin family protein [Brevundimonas]|uniref:flavodoxin family protein n=1 Tax=Brevundimonas sp. 357 TaxID=2555782 RepID=UPI001FB26E0B|nr:MULTISPECIES: flavodoxin family protein [Brevundimonas]
MPDPVPQALAVPEPRKGMPSPELDRTTFETRFRSRFADPAFDPLRDEIDRLAAAAWDGYIGGRKSPLTRLAGPSFAEPDYELALDWLDAHAALRAAEAQHDDAAGPSRILIINASSRSEHTCPGEMSKSWRLVQIAREVVERRAGMAAEILDLSRLASEYGREIHPCKACFSTAAALCHWPCSCYPNYSLGQVHDWMNDIYPMWVRAHGVLIVTPVNWYHASSPFKLMMDRLVCADGGNPDPTTTHGKTVALAKALELADWPYPRHLAGRRFALVVHGDVEGAENVRRSLSDWLVSMKLSPAGADAEIDRYIGYWEPYATSHDALDRDRAVQDEVRLAADELARAVLAWRNDASKPPEPAPEPPRQK